MYPVLCTIFGFPIRMYGLITILSIGLATGVAYFLAKQDGRWHQHVLDIGIYGGAAGIIGGRLWDVFFFDWGYYSHHLTEIFNVWQGGMAIQGGILFGTIAGVIYCKKHHIDCLEFGDIVCPSMIFGQAVGRMANLLNGDAFGAPTGGSFGILYPAGTLAHSAYGTAPLWPAEIWEGQIDILIFAILLIYRSTEPAKGRVLFLYPMLYSTARFFLEYLRGDYAASTFMGLKSAQCSSVLIFLIALTCFICCGRKNKENS
ncbi:MAG: prolipoprotein diacylglyceryl transferase [Acidaminococcaceae bacterium]|nr:prolipoprotein diacylglyceryl transferase [Acidaminococcaceae bacterium]